MGESFGAPPIFSYGASPMPMIEVMTELEAVNEMLMSIGQAPVNTLNATGISDVNIARAELVKVSRRVQARGWNFNTDDAYKLSPDADGKTGRASCRERVCQDV